jgi:hypothetical protein
MQQTLRIGSTNVARLRRLRDDEVRAFLADADVTGTLKDANDVDVAGATNLAMTYVAGSLEEDGEYHATIPHTVALQEGANYTFVVTAVAQNGSQRLFHVPCVAVLG